MSAHVDGLLVGTYSNTILTNRVTKANYITAVFRESILRVMQSMLPGNKAGYQGL